MHPTNLLLFFLLKSPMPQHGSVTCFSPGNELVLCVLNPSVSLYVLMCCSFVPVFAAVLSHRGLRVHSALTTSKGGWQSRGLKEMFVWSSELFGVGVWVVFFYIGWGYSILFSIRTLKLAEVEQLRVHGWNDQRRGKPGAPPPCPTLIPWL